MKMSNGLDIMLVYDGAFLDDDSFAELMKVSEELKCQTFIETVQRQRTEDAIYLADGEIAL
jgi:hypothetical protein